MLLSVSDAPVQQAALCGPLLHVSPQRIESRTEGPQRPPLGEPLEVGLCC